jgi:hypothetical protein
VPGLADDHYSDLAPDAGTLVADLPAQVSGTPPQQPPP